MSLFPLCRNFEKWTQPKKPNKCFCGRVSVTNDSRFPKYTPCELHKHMSPVLYQKATDAYCKR